MIERKKRRSNQLHMYRHRCNPKRYAKSRLRRELYYEKTIFCTKSEHTGQWDNTGIIEDGIYDFFYGVNYEGNFNDSMFHGQGILMYPNGAKLEGWWENAYMVAHRYIYADGLLGGPYCEMPDRRFYLEIKDHIYPAGRSLLSNACKTRKIPDGMYDTGDGFYDTVTKCVYDPKDLKKVIRIPTQEQHNWIVKHCRKAWDEPVGFKPEYYESWQRKQETETAIERKTSKEIMKKSIDYLSYRKNFKRFSYK